MPKKGDKFTLNANQLKKERNSKTYSIFMPIILKLQPFKYLPSIYWDRDSQSGVRSTLMVMTSFGGGVLQKA